MWPLIKDLFHAALYDKDRAVLWLRGGLSWLGTMAALTLGSDQDWSQWTWKQWVTKLTISGVSGSAGLVRFGEKNRPEPPNA